MKNESVDTVPETILSYEAKADEYIHNTHSLSFFPELPAMLDHFISMLPGKHVLDVAFGSGRDTHYLLSKGLDVEGIELTQAFIEHLSQQVAIPLHQMDMRKLTFADESFDGIWCCSAFLHLPRRDALSTLQGFHRILRSNGILYIDLKEGYGEQWVNNTDGHVTNTSRYFTYYQLDEIVQLIEEADFTVDFTRIQSHPKYTHKHNWLNIISCRHN